MISDRFFSLFRLPLLNGLAAALTFIYMSQTVSAQANGTLGLADGFLSFNTSVFAVQLVKDSQTLYSLKPRVNNTAFDFIPADQMTLRQNNGNYHLGDITFRVRKVGSTTWLSGDTSAARKPVVALPISGSTLAAADLTPTLPSNSLLNITRRWTLKNDQLQLLFAVQNSQTVAVEIGALGAPLEFNNVRTLQITITNKP
jgi:hypothetical protein